MRTRSYTIDTARGPRHAGRGVDSDRGRCRRTRRSALPVQSGERSVHRPAIPDRRQGTRFAMSATPWPSWSPIPLIRLATRSRPSTSNGTPLPVRGRRSSRRLTKGAPQVWPRQARQRAVRRASIGDKSQEPMPLSPRRMRSPKYRDRQPARHHQLHGNARGGLRIRRQARSPHADNRQPGQPSPARNPAATWC